jgi:catechol 2,3-dioxygenase-like lactoylglutathione lyase family enzyme
MDKTVRFYRDVLGCKLVATIGTDRFRHYFFSMGERNTIAFFEWPGITPGPSKAAGVPEDGRQFDHLSFNVDTYEEFLALQKRLRDAGLEVTRVVDHEFIHSIYFDDPNGIALEASVWLMDPETQYFAGDPQPVAAVREQGLTGQAWERRQRPQVPAAAPPDPVETRNWN